MATPINLTYWPIRGLVESVVTLLEYVGYPYNLISVESRDTWNQEKLELHQKGCEFPNLPYIEHDGKYISESFALLAYVTKVAKKQEELLPTQENLDRFLELHGVILDLHSVFAAIAYRASSDEEIRNHVREGLKRHNEKLVSFSKILSKSKWLLGDQLSILDFRFAEDLEKILVMNEELKFEDFGMDLTHFKRYLHDFLNIPQVKAYRESGKFNQRPFNNFHAYWK